jgi:solute carrier family 35, member E1
MGIRPPSRELIMTTLPLTGFMIGGHILTSDAMSRIPVSLVHTIKGLSPLFTVVAYRFFYNISYSWPVYASLIPLTVGVIMACSTTFSDNFLGLCSAFASAILFVTQNIVSKKLFNEAALAEQEGSRSRKPDKLNLLCYSSLLAFLFTFPLWLWAEGFSIIGDIWTHGSVTLSNKAGTLDHGRLIFEYIFNGTFHFLQSLVAFQLLSMVSPVTYSVASLIKRVFVICFAILWFGNTITQIQGFGIALTFLGLYLYDRTHDAQKADRKARQIGIRAESTLLPLHEKPFESPPLEANTAVTQPNGYAYSEEKKNDAAGPGRPEPNFMGWLPLGTKAEETWKNGDVPRSKADPVS